MMERKEELERALRIAKVFTKVFLWCAILMIAGMIYCAIAKDWESFIVCGFLCFLEVMMANICSVKSLLIQHILQH